MATISDMSHAMNVGNLESLIAFCTGSGIRYNPSTLNLTVGALLLTEIEANKILGEVKVARTNFNHDVDVRRSHFTEFKELVKRAINELLKSDASDLAISAVIEIQKKIDGINENSVKKTEIPAGNIGTSPIMIKKILLGQLSFMNQLGNFEKLLKVLKQEKSYDPNQKILKTDQLQTRLTKLTHYNTNVINSEILLDNLKITRSNFFYAPETGMVTIAFKVKKYIKETFGKSSIQFRQVNQLKFINIKIYNM